MSARYALVAAAVLVGQACGNQCTHAAQVATRYVEKAKPCGIAQAQAFDTAKCDESLKRCTPSELGAIDAYLSCVDALPACAVENESDFARQFLACASGMQHIEPSCFVLE